MNLLKFIFSLHPKNCKFHKAMDAKVYRDDDGLQRAGTSDFDAQHEQVQQRTGSPEEVSPKMEDGRGCHN